MSNGTDKIYTMVTDRIVKALEEGTVPWQRPWRVEGGVHKNLVSKKGYRGVNQFLLDLTAMSAGYSSPWWMSYKQAGELGGNVKKGEKATVVVFFKPIKVKTDERDENGKEVLRTIPLLRYYRVFNVEQTEGIPAEKIPQVKAEDPEFTPIEQAEKVIAEMPNRPTFSHGGDRAYYMPSTDAVRLPKPEKFDAPEHYYSTAFHEFVHSTGHKSRLARIKDWTGFGSDPYAREELVAEMGAAMLDSVVGIENTTADNSAAYIASWIKRFQEDKKLLVQAGSKAQAAADYILGIEHEDSTEQPKEAVTA